MNNLMDIQNQIGKLQKEAEDIKARDFDNTVQEILAKMQAFGITVKDLIPRKRRGPQGKDQGGHRRARRSRGEKDCESGRRQIPWTRWPDLERPRFDAALAVRTGCSRSTEGKFCCQGLTLSHQDLDAGKNTRMAASFQTTDRYCARCGHVFVRHMAGFHTAP